MHWTYHPEDPEPWLCQGDLIRVEHELPDQVMHHFDGFGTSANQCHLMVLTQTCDLVRTSSRRPKCSHIALCGVAPLQVVLDRYAAGLSAGEPHVPFLCPVDKKTAFSEFLQRLLNNNEPAYFYLHESPDAGVPERLCAFLTVSVAVDVGLYDTLLEHRVISIRPEFRAKLGWLIGNEYSRVATPDWFTHGGKSRKDFTHWANEMLAEMYCFCDDTQLSHLRAAIGGDELDIGDRNAIETFIESAETSETKVLTKMQSQISHLAVLRDQPELVEKIMTVVRQQAKYLRSAAS